MKAVKSGLILLVIVLLTGCNSIKGTKFPENYIAQLPENTEINVPHIMQRDGYSCATTSLAMVMSYYDKKVYSKSDVWNASGSSKNTIKKSGNDMSGLKKAAEKYGFTNHEFVIGLSINEIKYLLSKGIPVIVNIRNFSYNSSHAVVIIGYDKKGFLITDPIPREASYMKDYKTFSNHWWAYLSSPRGRVNRSAFIVYPK